MGAQIYSHSRLASFENCPRQFYFRYVAKIPADTEGIEAFVGKRVHEVLERLYLFVERDQVPSINKVVARFNTSFDETFDQERVRIVREGLSVDFYRELGERCLRNYYRQHYPFDQSETLGIEERVVFNLDEDGSYRMQGIIDRVARLPDGTIEIHDYKTGNYVPSQKQIDSERQLALYQIGLSQKYPDTPMRLVWHYVAHRQTRISHRSPEQLGLLRQQMIEAIDAVESETEFPARKIKLCDWCEYKNICPLWNPSHPAVASGEKPAPQSANTGARRSQLRLL